MLWREQEVEADKCVMRDHDWEFSRKLTTKPTKFWFWKIFLLCHLHTSCWHHHQHHHQEVVRGIMFHLLVKIKMLIRHDHNVDVVADLIKVEMCKTKDNIHNRMTIIIFSPWNSDALLFLIFFIILHITPNLTQCHRSFNTSWWFVWFTFLTAVAVAAVVLTSVVELHQPNKQHQPQQQQQQEQSRNMWSLVYVIIFAPWALNWRHETCKVKNLKMLSLISHLLSVVIVSSAQCMKDLKRLLWLKYFCSDCGVSEEFANFRRPKPLSFSSYEDQVYEPAGARIINGQLSKKGSWPWQVMMSRVSWKIFLMISSKLFT